MRESRLDINDYNWIIQYSSNSLIICNTSASIKLFVDVKYKMIINSKFLPRLFFVTFGLLLVDLEMGWAGLGWVPRCFSKELFCRFFLNGFFEVGRHNVPVCT